MSSEEERRERKRERKINDVSSEEDRRERKREREMLGCPQWNEGTNPAKTPLQSEREGRTNEEGDKLLILGCPERMGGGSLAKSVAV